MALKMEIAVLLVECHIAKSIWKLLYEDVAANYCADDFTQPRFIVGQFDDPCP